MNIEDVKKMTPPEKRKSIAELHGYEDLDLRISKGLTQNEKSMGLTLTGAVLDYIGIPDYLNDLNACHDMEKMLYDGHQKIRYMQFLGVITPTYGPIWGAVNASAEDRCNAFLATMLP